MRIARPDCVRLAANAHALEPTSGTSSGKPSGGSLAETGRCRLGAVGSIRARKRRVAVAGGVSTSFDATS